MSSRRIKIIERCNQALITKQSKKLVTDSIATRERSIDYYGILGNLPNPDPVLKARGQSISVYEELSYDSRVRACVSSRKAPIKSMSWSITSEEENQSMVDFYTSIFKKMNMINIISEMLDAWMYGYKITEIMWGYVDGKIIPVNLVGKPSEWFCFDEYNKLRFLSKENMIAGELLPDNKFLIAANEPTYKNPYGIPVLSACFWPVTFRKTGMRFFTQFIEKYGSPFLMAEAEAGAQEDRMQQIATMLDDMVQDAIAVVPAGWNIKLLEAAEGKGSGNSLHTSYIDCMNNEIQIAILGTNLTTEVKGGSYAASQSHMTVRDDIIEGDQHIVESCFNELIRMTHILNFKDSETPTFKLYREEVIDKEKSERDLNLYKQGVKLNKNYYSRAYSLKDDEYEISDVNLNRIE